MLGDLTLIMVVLAIMLVVINITVNRVPKTGRDGAANGERITAVITNNNKYADKITLLRAEKDGKKFKVKMKPTEANLWIKGDNIDIILGSDQKSYRVLFNDYFRSNEQRIREKAVTMLEKIKHCYIASRLVGYNKEMNELIKDSKVNSKQIFSFVTYMKFIDIYSVVAVLLTILTVVWKIVFSPATKSFILPLVLIIGIMWAVYGSVGVCKRILKDAQKL